MKRTIIGVVVAVVILWTGWANGRVHADDTVITALAAGDIACDPGSPFFNSGQGTANNCEETATSNLIVNAHPTAVFALGDQQYGGGTLPQFEASYDPSWGRGKTVTYPVPGNEDYATRGAAGYFAYFGTLARNYPGGYYSVNLGNWHIIALNSECQEPGVGGCGVGTPQERWLLGDLAANRSPCTLVMWHEPRFTSGKNGNHPQLQAFWDDIYAFGAAILLNGHDHIYERFAPQNAKQQSDPNGVQEFIVGTGGNNHQPRFGTLQPNNQVLDNTTFGVLLLKLGSGSYTWQFLRANQAGNGTLTDAGSGTCHGINAGTSSKTGPRAVPVVSSNNVGKVARFTVDYNTTSPGTGQVLFGPGPGCSGLIMTAMGDLGANTTHHAFLITGDELAPAATDPGIIPGATYWYETVTRTNSGTVIDDNGGKCYSVAIPQGH